jgi:hypothetical protein
VADLVPGLKLAHAEGKAQESGRALSTSMMPCAARRRLTLVAGKGKAKGNEKRERVQVT